MKVVCPGAPLIREACLEELHVYAKRIARETFRRMILSHETGSNDEAEENGGSDPICGACRSTKPVSTHFGKHTAK